ncbi:MAG: hypothetical protein RI885_2216 [Actinomycetota bacterium]|jgi:predicted regulator of Ras-like GTPase activity (Roadblock/LC7/MglB family)
MNGPLHRDENVIERSNEGLAALYEACRALVYATVATDDGFVVASILEGRVQASSMAGMASSMQALGDAVTRELEIGGAEYIIIAADRGYTIQLRIPGQPLVLSAVFDSAETVGKGLAASRVSALDISAKLLTEAA